MSPHHYMKTETEILIKRYFDATATKAEERRLRAILADPSTPVIREVEEARAVMGYTTLQKARLRPAAPRHHTVPWRTIVSIAASVAVVIAISVHFLAPEGQQPDVTIYAQGKISHSTEDALAIMNHQLGALGRSTENNTINDILDNLYLSNDNEP